MSRRQLIWTGPFPVDCDNATYRSRLRDSPGIYRIRALDSSGRPASIPRCNEPDPEGILHIGETAYLLTRLRYFRNAAFGNGSSNSSGCEFRDSGFASQFPKQTIYYDFAEMASKEAAVECERELHDEYRKRFHDKPPLDSSIGKSQPAATWP